MNDGGGDPNGSLATTPLRRWLSNGRWLILAGAILAAFAVAGLLLTPAPVPARGAAADQAAAMPSATGSPSASASVSGSVAPAPLPVAAPGGIAMSIVVPRLNVDSSVIPISGQSGSLLPPSNPRVIGWWREGPKIGSEAGTVLLTGHTMHLGGGAFDDLGQMSPGDTFVVTSAGVSYTYAVTAVTAYTKGDLAKVARTLFRLDGPPEVLLITCSNWTGTQYLDNVVVTGVPAV